MKITVVGAGYVGLVSGACFAEFGVDVVCVDKDKSKIDETKKNYAKIFILSLTLIFDDFKI